MIKINLTVTLAGKGWEWVAVTTSWDTGTIQVCRAATGGLTGFQGRGLMIFLEMMRHSGKLLNMQAFYSVQDDVGSKHTC